MTKNAGQVIVDILERFGVDRLFCVPGESFLPVLDALQDSAIETVLARHEGGAAMMAEADGKMTNRPGVALVTRGPGASNASSGVHVAQQDSTPMVLLVGQVARDMKGRDAFQEVDYQAFFGGMAKLVIEIDDANQLPYLMAKAWKTALEGRPGPVVISLPEDMLYDPVQPFSLSPVVMEKQMPDDSALDQLAGMIASAHTPVIIAGGPCWSDQAIASLDELAIKADIPVICSFRRQRLMNHLSPAYAGDLGLGCNPAILSRIKSSDLVILLGGRMSEIPSQSYSLFDIPHPQMNFVHIHRDPDELGCVYTPHLAIADMEEAVIDGLLTRVEPVAKTPRIHAAHTSYLDWTAPIPEQPGSVNMSKIVAWMRDHLPPESIMTNGAGNYATWLHRFYYFRDTGSQLAPTSGSMGYGIPAAVAASLRYPDRPVIAFAGDGCFQMTMQELATAYQAGARPIICIVDNGMYGTIRMHQERHFPGRGKLTELVNPDFVKLAESMGCMAFYLDDDKAFPAIMAEALTADRPVVIHIRIDPESITPAMSLSQIRTQAMQI
ncbi:MAG: thiamine pyrophosphate-dependent enzyme [Candidatus Puniceispirillales bacterium]